MPKTFPVVPVAESIPVVPAAAPTRIVPDDVQQYPATSNKKRVSGSYVPPAQQERILQRHSMGESIRKISREEHRDFRTIAKVIGANPAKLQEHLDRSRAACYALATQALETVFQALKAGNARLAYKLLVDTGVVPQPGQIPCLMQPEKIESLEHVARKKHVAELVEQVIERLSDCDLPSDSVK